MKLAKNIIQIQTTIVNNHQVLIALKSDGTVWRKVIAPYQSEWERI